MSYIKAEKLLPKELVEQIQKYADGVCIYIPRKEENRRSWGDNTGFKKDIRQRNAAESMKEARKILESGTGT